MKNYELTVLFSGKLDEKAISKKIKDFAELLTKTGAKITAKKDAEKKDMAYEINKERSAFYAFYELELDPANVLELDNKVKLEDGVIRYLLVKKAE